MSTIALDPLIAEAKRRARQRRLLAIAAALAVATGGAVYSLAHGSRPAVSRFPIPARATGRECGVRGVGGRILGQSGRALYREPARPMMAFPVIHCSGSSIWAVWVNGVGMSKQAYFGAHSGDGGRTWRPAFGQKAPHELDAELGPWTVRGRAAFFVGLCPACGLQYTVSLWVTRDGGRSFKRYDVSALAGYWPKGIRVTGSAVTISAVRARPGERFFKTAVVHTG